uniref:Uncharacterized protein n=1 Tax=Romanomermis culicivorax TaxID=13658 RepID=A0A915JAR9_ROMCU
MELLASYRKSDLDNNSTKNAHAASRDLSEYLSNISRPISNNVRVIDRFSDAVKSKSKEKASKICCNDADTLFEENSFAFEPNA